jgi:hypothetical protein
MSRSKFYLSYLGFSGYSLIEEADSSSTIDAMFYKVSIILCVIQRGARETHHTRNYSLNSIICVPSIPPLLIGKIKASGIGLKRVFPQC